MQADGRYRLDAATAGDDEPFVVYDAAGQVHEVLTAFGTAVAAAGQPATARAYVYALASFFAFVDADPGQRAARRRWDSPPDEIRAAVTGYLAGQPGGAGVLFAALRRFYRMQFALGSCPDPDPLAGLAGAPTTGRSREVGAGIADPLLHARLLLAGRRLGWGLRERCEARICLEGGAGLEEVLSLTLGGWLDRGMGREFVARGIGRDGWVRVLRVVPLTARLLHQYGETERRRADPAGLGLASPNRPQGPQRPCGYGRGRRGATRRAPRVNRGLAAWEWCQFGPTATIWGYSAPPRARLRLSTRTPRRPCGQIMVPNCGNLMGVVTERTIGSAHRVCVRRVA